MWWIWCDLDGSGRHWRLAVERDDMLYFPVEDFEEDGTLFSNYPSIEIEEPTQVPEVPCKVCKTLRPASEDWVRWRQNEPVCRNCWGND